MNHDQTLHDALKKIYGADVLLSYTVTLLLRDGDQKVTMRTIAPHGESYSPQAKQAGGGV